MSLFDEKKVESPNTKDYEPIKIPEIDMSIPWLDEPEAKPVGLFTEQPAAKPITREIHLVIDADSLIYKAAHVGYRDWVEPDASVKNHGIFTEQAATMLTNQIDIFNSMVAGIQHDVSDKLKLQGVGIRQTTLLFTPKTEHQEAMGLRRNFRYALVDDYNREEQAIYDEVNSTRAPEDRFVFKQHIGYKAKRKGAPVPANVSEIMTHALQHEDAFPCDGCEADDVAYAMKMDDPEGVVLCVIDKDILRGTPSGDIGHFNFNSRKFEHTTDDEANVFYYRQCIMGDSSDGIPGMYRCGVVAAEKTIPTWVSHEDAWRRVMELANSKGYTEQYMILQMRLVNLNQLGDDNEIHLWNPPAI